VTSGIKEIMNVKINSAYMYKGEIFKKISKEMTSGESFENDWFYMKYLGKYLSVERLLTRECRYVFLNIQSNLF